MARGRGGRGRGGHGRGGRGGRGRGQGCRQNNQPDGQNEWENEDSVFVNHNEQKPFQESPEPDRTALQANTPLEFLQLFFTDEIFDDIVYHSNLYYHQQEKVNPKWKDITLEEMKAFLGIVTYQPTQIP